MIDDPGRRAFDLRMLDHSRKVAGSVYRTDAARHRPVFGKRPAQLVRHHAIASRRSIQSAKVFGDGTERFRSIKIIGIDYGERLVNDIPRHQNRMVRSPGFHTPFGYGEPLGQTIQLLIDILHADPATETLFGENLLEVGSKTVADHEYHLAEASTNGVIYGIVDDGFVAGTYPVHLLERSVTGSHAGSQHQ